MTSVTSRQFNVHLVREKRGAHNGTTRHDLRFTVACDILSLAQEKKDRLRLFSDTGAILEHARYEIRLSIGRTCAYVRTFVRSIDRAQMFSLTSIKSRIVIFSLTYERSNRTIRRILLFDFDTGSRYSTYVIVSNSFDSSLVGGFFLPKRYSSSTERERERANEITSIMQFPMFPRVFSIVYDRTLKIYSDEFGDTESYTKSAV